MFKVRFPTPCVPSLLTVFLAATLDLALAGKDLLVQAKTGTGTVHRAAFWCSTHCSQEKTIAFLLPAIERLLKAPANTRQGVSILVLSPTRELALQVRLSHHARPDSYTLSSDPTRSRDTPRAPHFLSTTCHWGYKVRVSSPHTRLSYPSDFLQSNNRIETPHQLAL